MLWEHEVAGSSPATPTQLRLPWVYGRSDDSMKTSERNLAVVVVDIDMGNLDGFERGGTRLRLSATPRW